MQPKTIIEYIDLDYKLGFHIGKVSSKKLPLQKSFALMQDTPLRAYQIYLSNARGYGPPKVDIEDILETRKTLERQNRYACIHGCLLYNLAGSVNHRADDHFQTNLDKTCNGLLTELDIGTGFGAGVVVHIGSCKDKKKGIHTISKSIEHVLKKKTENSRKIAKALNMPIEEFVGSRKIILENCAGEGNKIGASLDEIAQIINKIDSSVKNQVQVCIDTAHIFGAGQYDFGSADKVVEFYQDFDNKIGLDKLECFHLNDSRATFGSKKDRHENIGLGHIFNPDIDSTRLDGLATLVEWNKDFGIPMIGEPPAKTSTGESGPGGIWDFAYINSICEMERQEFIC